MPAELRILEADETTVVTTTNEGNVATAGSSTPTQFYVNNFGTSNATEVTVSITAVGTNDGEDYLQIAEDVAGSPGTFSQDPIEMGTIAPLASVPFWIQIVQPSGLTANDNPRRANVNVACLTT